MNQINDLKHNMETMLERSIGLPIDLKCGINERNKSDFYINTIGLFKKQHEKYGFNFIIDYKHNVVKVWNCE